jgi:hypothetical protein
MAIVQAYPQGTPTLNDTVIGTQYIENQEPATKNFDISDILALAPVVQTALPYKIYTAKIGMGDGIATVFENTLGVTLTWTSATGQISTGNVSGLIGQNNVYIQVSSSVPSGNNLYIVSGEFTASPWVVRVKQNDNAGNQTATQYVFVEIRVYN